MRTTNAKVCIIVGVLASVAVAECWAQSPDLNGDGQVNVYDASIAGSCFGADLQVTPDCGVADLDGDGAVTLSDLQILKTQYGNIAPTADAGVDQAVTVGDPVMLDGSGSSDPNGDSLNFAWTIVDRPVGSSAVLADPAAVKPIFIADAVGDYVVYLVVDDGALFSTADTVIATASAAANTPPVADAGPNQSGAVGALVTLDGSGSSDVDGDVLDFDWTFVSVPAGSTASLSDPAAVKPSFVIDVAGDYVLQLVVNDGLVDSAPDSVTVSTDNSPPVADAGPNQSGTVGALVTLDGSGSSDVDGDVLDFDWTFVSVPAGSTASLSDPAAVKPSFVIDVAGDYVLQLVVNDGLVDSAPDSVTVSTDNSPPVADAGPNQSGTVGALVTLDGSGSSDVDGDVLDFDWTFVSVPAGSTASLSDPGAVKPSFVIDVAGDYVLQLVVNDGLVDSAPDSVTVSTDNSPPVADAGPNQSGTVGALVTLDGSGSSDVDGDVLDFDWTFVSVPAGSTASLSDPAAVKPSFVIDVAGDYVLQLVVNDGLVDSAPDSVTVSTDNSPPVADAGPNQSGTVGALVMLDGSGSSDVDGDVLDFDWTFVSVPAGSTASLSDPAAVKPSFVIDVAGDYVLQLVVNDGLVDSAPDSVTVSTDNSPPVADAGPNQSGTVGALVMLDGSGSSDVDGDVLDFDWTFVSVPAGSTASLSDPGAVKPSFVIDVAGDYVLQLVVNDGLVDSAPDSVTVGTDNSPPVADAGPDDLVKAGDTVQLDGAGSSDADNDPLSFFWSLLSVPQGSTAALSDPFAVDPTFAADLTGEYVAQLIVNDGLVDSAPDSVLVLAENQPPLADAGPDLPVSVGDTATLDGGGSSDPDGDSITFFWTLSPPAGSSAMLSDNTAVRPSFVADVAGQYQATLVVNDGLLDSAPDRAIVTASAVTVIAQDDRASTLSDQTVNIAVLDNDLPTGALSVVPASLTQPAHGVVGLNADGTISYSQAGLTEPTGMQLYKDHCSGCHSVNGFTGQDTFSYAASDGASSDSATVTVSVTTFDTAGSRGDISGATPSCSLFDSLRHIDCAGFGVSDADLEEIAQFLQQAFP